MTARLDSGGFWRTAILRAAVFAGLAALCFAPGGCGGSKPRTTRLRASDFDDTVEAMIQSLSASAFLAERTPSSAPAYITINKVENLTTDLIPEAEQWMLVARVRSALPLSRLWEQHRVKMQITPERHSMLLAAGFDGDFGDVPTTTHVLSAVFMSAPRADRAGRQGYVRGRTDRHYLEYSLTNLATSAVEWTDTFEVTREAFGLAID